MNTQRQRMIGSPGRRLPCAALLLAALLGAGCSGNDQIGDGPVYPADPKQSAVLDIQVVRSGTEITLTNTTASPLPKGLMWINAWYSAPFEGLGVGQSTTMSLGDFHDRYGGEFRKGGFFATELPDRLVLAQIQADGKILGLVVVRGE